LIPEFIFTILFIGLAEEPGFRGFALPRLLAGRPTVVASLILGVLHTIWHLPLFVSGSEPLIIIPVILGGAFLLTWLFLNTRGSVLLAILMHSSVNVSQQYFSGLLPDTAEPRQLALLAAVYVLAAAILIGLTGPDLIRRAARRPVGTLEA
jgi:membrane protease YdiL (CAAX protease family)